MFGWDKPEIALVSNALPPGGSGYQHILEQLLGAVPEETLATCGIGAAWGRRTRIPFPGRRSAPGVAESLVATGATVLAEGLAPAVLRRLFPRIRRVFATMDPTLGFATSWARGAGLELWVYAIDLHVSAYWRSGQLFQGRLAAWCKEAFRYATRVFALSTEMAGWLRSIGVNRAIEILPPLFPVGEAKPLPAGPPTFLMSGVVYSVNAGPLRWLEHAVRDLAPQARLRLITPSSDDEIRAAGLDLGRWSRAKVTSRQVVDEVAGATWCVIGVDSGRSTDGERVAWPTKLREYLSVGRPVLCISRPEYAISKMAAANAWGLVAHGEEETRAAVARIVSEPTASLEGRARAAHRFARENIDDGTIGAAFRRDLCA